MFDRLFVIHCKPLRDRREHIEATLARIGWQARWITDFDASEISRATWRRVTGRLNKGEVSVYLKHLAVYAEMVEDGAASAFVLEDDAIFPDDFVSTFERYLEMLPADYGMVCFGASTGLETAPLPGQTLYGNACRTRSMSGYLITRSCAAWLSEQLANRPIVKAIDATIDDFVRAGDLTVYWSVPAIIENGSETGLFRHSLGVRRRDSRFSARLLHRVGSIATKWMR